MVPDIDDYCPETPEGVKVDANGCPLDDDKDGIPNHIDEEANTPRGAIVNEKGVQLSDEQSKSMYSKFNAASREYANYYNENEISKDDFTSLNDYLIAKANAFNIVNDIPSIETKVEGKRFAIMLGEYKEDVPANVINTYLSFDDLESLMQNDGMVVYSVGSYNTFDDAINRQTQLEINEGMVNTEIVEVENGVVSLYNPTPPAPITPEVIEKEVDQEEVTKEEEPKEESAVVVEQVEEEAKQEVKSTVGKITFRVQIGAYKVKLSKDIFKGVPNMVSFTTNDGYTRYFTGSFSSYADAVKHQNDMLLRGFEGSFVVAFKDGKKIGLYAAIRATNGKIPRKTSTNLTSKVEKEEIEPNLEFVVQICVYKGPVPANVLSAMAKIGNVSKENMNGSQLYRYNAGTYSDLSAATTRLDEVESAGFEDAFVKALLDGEQITIEKAKALSE